MGFSRQEYWSGLPFPSPGDLPDPGIKAKAPVSPTLAGGFFTNCATWEALNKVISPQWFFPTPQLPTYACVFTFPCKLPHGPENPLLGMHTKETRTERDTCAPVFIAALCTIARTWKQPRCPSADKWIRKLWYIYTVEYYSAIKNNTFELVLMRWMKLEPIIQTGVSQKEKQQHSILTHIYGI